MKLRIKGNSLRLRVSRSDTELLMRTGRVAETIRFAIDNDAKLTYALEHSIAKPEICVQYQPWEVTVTLPTEEARRWSQGDQVGLYRDFALGEEVLAVLVEKDFACLDGSEADNEDAFENPNHAVTC